MEQPQDTSEGGTRPRRRTVQVVITAAVLVAAVAVAVTEVTGGGSPGGKVSLSPGVDPAGMLTASQIAHGTWRDIPAPPIRICEGAAAVWDGNALVIVEASAGKFIPANSGTPSSCHAAAAYNPVTGSWKRLPPPPAWLHGELTGVWAVNRLVVVAPQTGSVAQWSVDTGRWRLLPKLPTDRGVYSPALASNGRTVVAVGTGRSLTGVVSLAGNRWKPLPDLPVQQPKREVQQIGIDAVAAGYVRGRLYAQTTISWWWKSRQNPGETSGRTTARLQRLDGNHWTLLPRSAVPLTTTSIQPYRDRLVVIGRACPPYGSCPQIAGAAVAIVPTGTGHSLQPAIPAPKSLTNYTTAFTGNALVAYFTANSRAPGPRIHVGDTRVYDFATRHWIVGPHAPHPPSDPAVEIWTPHGFVVIGTGSHHGQILTLR